MKINIHQIPAEGLVLEEEVDAVELALGLDYVKFNSPIRIKAQISKITNVLSVEISLGVLMELICSRCLREFGVDLRKDFRLNYPINPEQPIIDLTPQIREEIILAAPLKPLCRPDCKGLCPECGRNLNEAICNCESKIK